MAAMGSEIRGWERPSHEGLDASLSNLPHSSRSGPSWSVASGSASGGRYTPNHVLDRSPVRVPRAIRGRALSPRTRSPQATPLPGDVDTQHSLAMSISLAMPDIDDMEGNDGGREFMPPVAPARTAATAPASGPTRRRSPQRYAPALYGPAMAVQRAAGPRAVTVPSKHASVELDIHGMNPRGSQLSQLSFDDEERVERLVHHRKPVSRGRLHEVSLPKLLPMTIRDSQMEEPHVWGHGTKPHHKVPSLSVLPSANQGRESGTKKVCISWKPGAETYALHTKSTPSLIVSETRGSPDAEQSLFFAMQGASQFVPANAPKSSATAAVVVDKAEDREESKLPVPNVHDVLVDPTHAWRQLMAASPDDTDVTFLTSVEAPGRRRASISGTSTANRAHVQLSPFVCIEALPTPIAGTVYVRGTMRLDGITSTVFKEHLQLKVLAALANVLAVGVPSVSDEDVDIVSVTNQGTGGAVERTDANSAMAVREITMSSAHKANKQSNFSHALALAEVQGVNNLDEAEEARISQAKHAAVVQQTLFGADDGPMARLIAGEPARMVLEHVRSRARRQSITAPVDSPSTATASPGGPGGRRTSVDRALEKVTSLMSQLGDDSLLGHVFLTSDRHSIPVEYPRSFYSASNWEGKLLEQDPSSTGADVLAHAYMGNVAAYYAQTASHASVEIQVRCIAVEEDAALVNGIMLSCMNRGYLDLVKLDQLHQQALASSLAGGGQQHDPKDVKPASAHGVHFPDAPPSREGRSASVAATKLTIHTEPSLPPRSAVLPSCRRCAGVGCAHRSGFKRELLHRQQEALSAAAAALAVSAVPHVPSAGGASAKREENSDASSSDDDTESDDDRSTIGGGGGFGGVSPRPTTGSSRHSTFVLARCVYVGERTPVIHAMSSNVMKVRLKCEHGLPIESNMLTEACNELRDLTKEAKYASKNIELSSRHAVTEYYKAKSMMRACRRELREAGQQQV